ncbi:MAG: hypothetical protein JWR45_3034 [Blastococcus sp.]|jgi:hypothetical protein|nr:hypothetical protein [Blastococcus sp.]
MMTLLTGPAVLSGCADKAGTEASSASTTPESPSASSTTPADASEDGATEAPPFPADAEPDTAAASADASVTVSDIRIARHDGFDRVVFEVGGTGTPGWDVQYVDAASSQGSGDVVDVAGDAVLQVTLTGAGLPYDTGVEEFSPSGPVTGAGTAVVTEAAFDATFEGSTVTFVGTTQRTPFRVYLLGGPTRVVLEVADPA